MKLSASALEHFLVCATATAVVSSASTLVAESETRTQLEGNTGEEKSQQYYAHHMNNHGHHYHNQSMGAHDNGLNTTRDGALNNTSISVQRHSEQRTPCHPDLGVLACPKPNQRCQKSPFSDSVTTSDEHGNTLHLDIEEWQCIDVATMHRQLQFPPSGEIYDLCTYEKKLMYNYNSTIRYPSAWDLCVCKYYDYQLPDGQSFIYTDVEYCHNINKYYCATYYDASVEMEPSAYDACLCSVYNGKAIPNKENDFCFELPMRYCDAYYVGNVTGIAQCLCDTFGYDDWCDFDPPDGFTFPSPTPPSNEPTIAPTLSPSYDPTQQPSTSSPPSGKPTISPNPTNKPTRRRRKPGNNKKKNQTPEPTSPPKPTPFPTRARVINLIPQRTSKPTAKTSPHPTPKPTDTRLKPTPSGFLTVIDFPKADNNDLHNVDNLSKVITSIRRQPNIGNRPGGALRLPVVSFFRQETKEEEVVVAHGIGP